MESRTGVRWGGERCASGWVNAAGVDIGPFRVSVRDAAPVAAAGGEPEPISRAFALPAAAEVTLDLSLAAAGQPAWRVSRVLVLFGRSASCRVHLGGQGVSSLHAALLRTPRGAWIVDLLTPRGITVNGTSVRYARLEDNDEVGIGPHRVGVRLGWSGLPARVEALTASRAMDPPQVPASVLEEFARMQEMMADQFQQALMTMFRMFGGMHQEQMKLIREELAQIRDLTDEQRSLQERLARVERGAEDPESLRLRLARESLSDGEDSVPSPAPALTARPPSLKAPTRDESAASIDLHLQIARRLASIRDERQSRWQKLIGSMLGKGTDRASS